MHNFLLLSSDFLIFLFSSAIFYNNIFKHNMKELILCSIKNIVFKSK